MLAIALVGLVTAAALLGPTPTTVDPAPVATSAEDVEVPVGAAALGASDDGDAAVPGAGRVFAAEGSVRWERELPAPTPVDDVVAAGPGHVLVGDRVVPTGPGGAAPTLLALPPAVRAGALDDDGRWAVAEDGRVTLGAVDLAAATTVEVVGPWVPDGPVVAWSDGEPVIGSASGVLGRVGRAGEVRWTTPEPLGEVAAVGERWLATGGDAPTAVSLADGRVVPLDVVPLAFHDDLAVLPGPEVLGRDLVDGTDRWTRPDLAGRWRQVGEHLVVVAAGAALRIDPATGQERGRVDGFVPAATASTVVVQVQSRLQAMAWSGRLVWERELDARATHVLRAVAGDRVAVLSEGPDGARVTVLDAADGATLTVAPSVAASSRALSVDGGVATVRDGAQSLLTVAVTDGADRPAGEAGDATGRSVPDVEVGVVTLRGEDRWTRTLDAPVVAGPARAGTSIVLGLGDGSVVAVAPSDGTVRWRRALDVLPTSVASDGVQLLVGTADGTVLRLDDEGVAVTRAVVGSGRVEAVVPGRPALALLGDRLVAVDLDG